MRLYTAQMAKHRQLKDLGVCLLDTTVKTGDRTFAPTWDIVMGIKAGEITEQEYTTAYLARMRESYRRLRRHWLWVLRQDVVVLLCYCKAGDFCHRLLLVDIFRRIAEKEGLPLIYGGELSSKEEIDALKTAI